MKVKTIIGFSLLSVIIIEAILAKILYPQGVLPIYESFLPPSPSLPLGTTFSGKSIFAEFLYGSVTALEIGISTALLSIILGLIVALMEVFRRVSVIMNVIVESFISIPKIPIIILFGLVLPPKNIYLILIMGFLFWPEVTRVIQPKLIQILTSEYYIASKAIGSTTFWRIKRYILPRLLQLLLVQFSLITSRTNVVAAGLNFLGLGNPETPSWGNLIRDAFLHEVVIFTNAWIWWVIPPSVMLVIYSLSFILIAESFEETKSIKSISKIILINW